MKKLYRLLLVSGLLMQSVVSYTMNTSWNIFNSESDVLIRAEQFNDYRIFFKKNVEELSDVNAICYLYCRNALMVAAADGDVELMQFVINKGADLDIQDGGDGDYSCAGYRGDNTALMIAAMGGHIEAVKLLLEKGANINIKERYYGQTALTYSIEYGYVEIVKMLLDKDVDGRCGSEELIRQLKGYGKFKSVKILLDSGVNVETQDKFGNSALIIAVMSRRIDIIQLFIEHGANVNFQTYGGFTAFNSAQIWKDFEVIELLKAAGATK